MKRLLLLAWLSPAFATAQEVKPVLSDDYLRLIKKDSISLLKKIADSSNNMTNATLGFGGYNYSGKYLVKKINTVHGHFAKISPVTSKYFAIMGSVSATVELQQVNRLPLLQNEYTQGRSVNGALAWRGPETGDPFSYGPLIRSLEFDGIAYPYDDNGHLMNNGNGQGKKAIAYDNSVLRPASLFSHEITLATKYHSGGYQVIGGTFKLGQSREQTFITSNKNKAAHFLASLDASLNKLTINGSYNYRQENFSNNNRDGFLNRVYQNSLLSPASFATRQGNTIGAAQRTYSPQADNPFFLMADANHSFFQQQQTGNLVIEKKFIGIKIKLAQSIEKLQQTSQEGHQPGTAFFPIGAPVNRRTLDNNYSLNVNFLYTIPFDNYNFKAQATANYIYANNQSAIDYLLQHSSYRYQRSSHDIALSFSPVYSYNYFETGWVISNKIYASNTTGTDAFFGPGISAYVRVYPLKNVHYLSAKLFGSINRFFSEPAINQSYAAASQMQYKVADAMQWISDKEVNSFNGLAPVQHQEFNAGIEIDYRGDVTFSADWFDRHTVNDIFPIMNNGQLDLVNLASHCSRGIELQLKFDSYPLHLKDFFIANSISYVSYNNKVTTVNAGYNFTPVAGFSDIHKAIVKDEPLGVIVGNTWLKDAANNIIIGSDGFPLVNSTPSVIGNPIPDFVMKMSQQLTYKSNWKLNIDWEWRKGGDIWNGTQAMLDYYGRSLNTANLRNTINYVFTGVQANGSHNTIPVSFYDPSLPVEQNRWVRYGPAGVAESYIQKGDCIRLRNIGITHSLKIKKYLQQLSFTLYANNIMIGSPYKGTDPNQLLDDQPATAGLDFFNLPSTRSFGFNVSLQF